MEYNLLSVVWAFILFKETHQISVVTIMFNNVALLTVNWTFCLQSISTNMVLYEKFVLVSGSNALKRNCFLFIERDCCACVFGPGCVMGALTCYS